MSTPVATYDPSATQIILGATPMSGFADGTFVSVEQDEDSFSTKTGADGEVARAKRVGRTGTMKLTLLATSIMNAVLSAYNAADTVFPVLVKEGASIVFASDGWVQKPAAFERGTDVADCEWTIRLKNVAITHGGNP